MIYFLKNNFSIRMLWTLKKYTYQGNLGWPIHLLVLWTAEFYEADLFYYWELYKAVVNGDWKSASKLLEDNPTSFLAPIRRNDPPMLHIAVDLGEASMGFVEKLVEFMPSEALSLQDSDGATALFTAAMAGNIKAAKLLVDKNPSLPNICSYGNLVPLHSALKYGHKELTSYLLSVTRDDVYPSPFADKPGFELLRRALMVGFNGELYLPSPIYFLDMNYCRVPMYNFIIRRCGTASGWTLSWPCHMPFQLRPLRWWCWWFWWGFDPFDSIG